MAKKVACLGDPSDHGGLLTTTNSDNKLTAKGIPVCISGCSHSCPIPGHGVTAVTAVTLKSYHNGILILTEGSIAACGAVIAPPDRGVFIE